MKDKWVVMGISFFVCFLFILSFFDKVATMLDEMLLFLGSLFLLVVPNLVYGFIDRSSGLDA